MSWEVAFEKYSELLLGRWFKKRLDERLRGGNGSFLRLHLLISARTFKRGSVLTPGPQWAWSRSKATMLECWQWWTHKEWAWGFKTGSGIGKRSALSRVTYCKTASRSKHGSINTLRVLGSIFYQQSHLPNPTINTAHSKWRLIIAEQIIIIDKNRRILLFSNKRKPDCTCTEEPIVLIKYRRILRSHCDHFHAGTIFWVQKEAPTHGWSCRRHVPLVQMRYMFPLQQCKKERKLLQDGHTHRCLDYPE